MPPRRPGHRHPRDAVPARPAAPRRAANATTHRARRPAAPTVAEATAARPIIAAIVRPVPSPARRGGEDRLDDTGQQRAGQRDAGAGDERAGVERPHLPAPDAAQHEPGEHERDAATDGRRGADPACHLVGDRREQAHAQHRQGREHAHPGARQAEVGAHGLRERRQARHEGAQVRGDEHDGERTTAEGCRRPRVGVGGGRGGRSGRGGHRPEHCRADQGRCDSGTSSRASSSSSAGDDEQVDDHRAHLSADHLGRQPGSRVDPRRQPGHPLEHRAGGRRGRVLVEHPGEVVGGVGQRRDEVDVAVRHDLLAGDGDRGPPGEHAQVAHAPVERHDELRGGLGRRGVPAQQRGLAHDRHALGGRRAQLDELALQGARLVQGRVREHPVAAAQGGDDVPQRRRDARARCGPPPAGAAARARSGAIAPMTSATSPPTRASSHRENAAFWSATSATMNTDCTPAWMTSSWPDDSTNGEAHRDDDDDGHLPGTGAEHEHDEVTDEDADRDADGHLGDAPQPLAVGEPEAEDRRDRREERVAVPEDVLAMSHDTTTATPICAMSTHRHRSRSTPGRGSERTPSRLMARAVRSTRCGASPRGGPPRRRHPPARPSAPSAVRRRRRRGRARAPFARRPAPRPTPARPRTAAAGATRAPHPSSTRCGPASTSTVRPGRDPHPVPPRVGRALVAGERLEHVRGDEGDPGCEPVPAGVERRRGARSGRPRAWATAVPSSVLPEPLRPSMASTTVRPATGARRPGRHDRSHVLEVRGRRPVLGGLRRLHRRQGHGRDSSAGTMDACPWRSASSRASTSTTVGSSRASTSTTCATRATRSRSPAATASRAPTS